MLARLQASTMLVGSFAISTCRSWMVNETLSTACTSFLLELNVRDRFLSSNLASLGIFAPDLALRDDADHLLYFLAVWARDWAAICEAVAHDLVRQVRRRAF